MKIRTMVGLAFIAATVVGSGLVLGSSTAYAHECTYDPDTGEEIECHDTPVADDWRGNFVPVAGVNDREESRKETQRWRDEYGCDTQYCQWVNYQGSVSDGSPQSVHAGMAADHSMFEAAHSSEQHDEGEFNNHDSHGGALYVDICVTSDEGTSYEDHPGACEGPEDTQAGYTHVDHLTCPMGCLDEYHVVKPLDPEYTQEQADNSIAEAQADVADPKRWLCGYEEKGSACYDEPFPE